MMPTKYEDVVFDLFLHKFGRRAGGFTTCLFDAIAAADESNKDKLSLAFPLHVAVWKDWYNASSEREFFEQFGLKGGGAK